MFWIIHKGGLVLVQCGHTGYDLKTKGDASAVITNDFAYNCHEHFRNLFYINCIDSQRSSSSQNIAFTKVLCVMYKKFFPSCTLMELSPDGTIIRGGKYLYANASQTAYRNGLQNICVFILHYMN